MTNDNPDLERLLELERELAIAKSNAFGKRTTRIVELESQILQLKDKISKALELFGKYNNFKPDTYEITTDGSFVKFSWKEGDIPLSITMQNEKLALGLSIAENPNYYLQNQHNDECRKALDVFTILEKNKLAWQSCSPFYCQQCGRVLAWIEYDGKITQIKQSYCPICFEDDVTPIDKQVQFRTEQDKQIESFLKDRKMSFSGFEDWINRTFEEKKTSRTETRKN